MMGLQSLFFFEKENIMSYKVINYYDEVSYYDDMDDAIMACLDDEYHWDDDYFEDWINDKYDYIDICGTTYYPYDILVAFDDNTMSDAKREYCESENDNDFENAKYELRNADIGRMINVQDCQIEVVADDEEEEEEEDTGDYDGDDQTYDDRMIDTIEKLREKLKQTEAQKLEEEKNSEKDIMQMLQVVGGK
jgi:hypothetical protein